MPVPQRLPTILALGGALCVALATWLLLPRPADEGAPRTPALRVALVDASASVVRRRPDWLPWIRGRLRDEARAARAAGEEVAVITFAEEVVVRLAPSEPARLEALLQARDGTPFDPTLVRDGESALAGALEVARGLAAGGGRPAGRVTLFGDGGWTGRDPAPERARLERAGVGFARVDPPSPRFVDGAILDLRLPPRAEEGAPLVAVVDLAIEGTDRREDIAWALLGHLRGPSGVRPVMQELAVPAELSGSGVPWRATVAVELGPAEFGRSELELGIVAGGGAIDPVPENDVARASVVAEGELVVGVVATEVSDAAARTWMAAAPVRLPGLQILHRTPEELPAVLGDLDVLVTFDTPLDQLPRDLVEPFVRRGGGWLALSGWGFLGDWSPGGTEASPHALLPLRPAEADHGPRDVILLVDGSGSMAGEPFDLVRTAAVEMVAAALPTDEITLRFFTERLRPPSVVRARSAPGADRSVARQEALRSLLAQTVPGGSTWILSSLEDLAAEREEIDREALVLLLSDGRERGSYPDADAKARALVGRFRAARTRVRVIAIGEDAHLEFLGKLVPPGEEVVRAGDLSNLEQIFQREVNHARVQEGEALVALRRPARPGSLAAELGSAPGASGAPGEAADRLPPLGRFARNELREGAECLWESADGEPLLGLWRVGSGRTALFASCPREDWAPEWVGRPARFGPLLRWLGRGRVRGGPEARLAGRVLHLEGLSAAWPAIVAARVGVPPGGAGGEKSGEEVQLILPPGGPGGDPLDRRSGELPPSLVRAAAGSTLTLSFTVPPGADLPPGPHALAVPVPRAPEFSRPPGPPVEAPAATPDPADRGTRAPAGAPRASTLPGDAHPAAAPVLGLGLLGLFGAGILARRAGGQGSGRFGR